MAIIERKDAKFTIDLDGPDGNAFALLGYAKTLSEDMGFSEEKKERIQQEMTRSDYETLIQVFDLYFGEVVDLIR